MATLSEPRLLALDHFAAAEGEMPLLRISTAGSVDDGKSTLIGRLLYDSRAVWDDHLEEVRTSKVNRSGRALDLSLLTDGLRAEREQGITIDVAYRYFSSPRRKFIIADTPGHEQYTRNMATGASTASLAVILVDARKGLLEQSRRHAFIAWLLGVRRLVFAINKMDLVEFRQDVFDSIRGDAALLLDRLEGARAVFVPLSALDGDNVVTRSQRMPWYTGPSLLDYLESVEPETAAAGVFRMGVQYVIRPHLDFRGYAGQIASGTVRVGDRVVALPGHQTSTVRRIVTFDGDLAEACAPLSVTLELDDDLDIARGHLLANATEAPQSARRLEATVVWMTETPLEAGKRYLLQQGARTVPARVRRIVHRWDVAAMEPRAAGTLSLNEIGRVELETAEPLAFDVYADSRLTGAFILVDELTNATAAAGMIACAVAERAITAPLSAAERSTLFGHRAAWLDLTNHPHLAAPLERHLAERGCHVLRLNVAGFPIAPLLAAGLLVLTVEPCPGTPTWAPAPDELSAEPETATSEIAARLRRLGILVERGGFQQGEGI